MFEIIRTKLMPPRLRAKVLPRVHLTAKLRGALDYRLTLIHAGTGYGKSTALVSSLAGTSASLFWYNITETDSDPLSFLLYLIHAFQAQLPSVPPRPTAILEEKGGRAWRLAVEALINELTEALSGEAFFVLDDYHLVNPSPEVNAIVEYFVECLPPSLHLLISTRQLPNLSALTHWRVKGELLEITRQDLAFSPQEIEALFRIQYGYTLTPQQVEALAVETEGWVMALYMIWQGLQSGSATSVEQVLAILPRSLEELFSYLAREVLAKQPPHLQDFLLRTAVLRQLEATRL